ncbi:zinc transporter ZupT [Acinetobacter thermotolerans]|uniref:zinc transporter ZupT n=1 Tax=Acinetobacter thermotolerans TaxID=3151487 RepID=UPI00325B4D4D
MDIAPVSDAQVYTAFALTIFAGLATLLGGGLVLFFNKPNLRMMSFGLAFAAGAMIYVSLTEILNKSIDSFSLSFGEQLGYAWGTVALLLGMVAVLLLDKLIPNPHETIEKKQIGEMGQEQLLRTGMLTLLAISAHNLPEGMATFFATLESVMLGAPLAVAIAIHNIPEGVAIALPVYMATHRKSYALLASLVSGLAEPLGAALGYFILAPFLNTTVYGVIFGLMGGVMIYLALDELLPTAKRYSKGHETVYGLISGMAALASSLVLFKFVQ